MKLTKRETATVLAALRFWQDESPNPKRFEHFDDCEELSIEEIDALCERINYDEDPRAALLQSVLQRWYEEIHNDEPIQGSDAVEWLVDFYEQVELALSKDSEVGVPCIKCKRTDLPLHYNRVCGACFEPEPEDS